MAPMKPTEAKDNQTDEVVIETTPKPRGGTPVVSDDKLKSATPGKTLSSSLYYMQGSYGSLKSWKVVENK